MGRRYCCVDGCPVRKTPRHNLSLFLLPKDPVAFQKWATILQPHRTFPVNKFCSVCELHFDPSEVRRVYTTKLKDGSDYTLDRGRISLAPGALPKYFGKRLPSNSAGIDNRERHESPETSKQEKIYEFHFEEGDESEESNHGEGEESNHGESEVAEDSLNKNRTVDGDSDIEIVGQTKDENDIVEVIFKEEVDYVSEGEEREDVSAPDESVGGEDTAQSRGTPTEPLLQRTELLDILEQPAVTDVDAFTRVCKNYIVSNKKRGRLSDIDKLSFPPRKKPHDDSQKGDEVVIYPFAKLDIFALVYNINQVTFPSDDWFCSMRDGTPVFLCWGEEFKIQKKVAFQNQRLDPKVILDGEEITLDEIVRPRSIHEVNNILKVVDSVRKCSPNFDEFRLCRGYFFTKPGEENETMCSNCRNASILPVEVVAKTFTFETICESAEYLVRGRTDWSFTRLVSAIVFIGWRRSYNAEKMFIINSDLSTRVLFGDVFTTIDGLEELTCIEDIQSAIEYLSLSRQCSGRGDGSRAEDCVGYVLLRDRSLGRRFGLRRVRCEPCRIAQKQSNTAARYFKTGVEQKRSKAKEEEEERISLIDSLQHIKFPSELWSHSVLGKTVILQNWDSTLSLLKKIVIQPDLSVQIFVLDCLVQIEGVQTVGSLREVTKLLQIVDCVRLCDGYGESRSKANGCVGYLCDPESGGPSVKRRCDSCEEVYRRSNSSQSLELKTLSSPSKALSSEEYIEI